MVPIFGDLRSIKRIKSIEKDTVRKIWTYHLDERDPNFWAKNGNMKLIDDINRWLGSMNDDLSQIFKKTLLKLVERNNKAESQAQWVRCTGVGNGQLDVRKLSK